MKIFVGCSSAVDLSKDYYDDSYLISSLLAKNGYDLVFGCYDKGIMGSVYKGFLDNNREVIGVLDKAYLEGTENYILSEKIVTDSVFERTKKLYELADACLFLPGGIGTYAEIFSFLDEKRTRMDNKKIIVYNYNGYYDKLIDFINYSVNEKFNEKKIINDDLVIISNKDYILDILKEEIL